MKNTKKYIYLLLLPFLIMVTSCEKKAKEAYLKEVAQADFYHESLNKLTEVMIHDIFSPPVASRIYSYANLAAYEAMVAENKDFPTMVGKIKDLKELPAAPKEEYCYPLAGIKAFMTVARGLTFSVQKYDDFENGLYKKFEAAKVPSEVIERSMKYGEEVGKAVLDYAKKDNYPQTRGLRYTLQNKPGTWKPTPPSYSDAVEPNWGTIRSMVLDSATQFAPPSPYPYDLAKTSPFMKEVMDVYEKGKTLSEEEKRIAWFWDDNAFVMNVVGHVMFANKKMTPGGHWLAITQTICKKNNTDLMHSVQAYLLVSMALRDAFIQCWKEKYTSHKIRPETVINESVDAQWVPYLQTPPFPEYTSGHSTISGASSVVLTAIFGDNVAFTDSTEHKFGHGVGNFKSFSDAAEQASISRVYGGIHFKSACDEGLVAGRKIGDLVLKKTEFKK